MLLNSLSSNKTSAVVNMNQINSNITNINRLIRVSEVMSLTGLKRSSLYAKVANKTFPSPLKIGERSSAWRINEVCRWLNDPMSYVVGSD